MIKCSRFVSQVVLVGNDRKFPLGADRAEFCTARNLCETRRFEPQNAEGFLREQKIVKLLEKQVDELTDTIFEV